MLCIYTVKIRRIKMLESQSTENDIHSSLAGSETFAEEATLENCPYHVRSFFVGVVLFCFIRGPKSN